MYGRTEFENMFNLSTNSLVQIEEMGISFNDLKRISDENFGKFNRSIDLEEIENEFPSIRNSLFKITKIMEHFHFMGELTEKHYRCRVTHNLFSDVLYQDVSINQWEKIKST